ncbi:MAG TPA: DMT family transporter [Paenibacillus sp.]|nr:DMT family transporter [Paenibacillus sp.]
MGYAAIFGAVVIWALSYIVMKSATTDYPQLLFQFWRYAGVAVLYVVCFRRAMHGISGTLWKLGLLRLGPAYFVLGLFSIYAVEYTTPTRVVVINSLIVGFVPLLRWLHDRVRPEYGERWAIGIALAAIALLLEPRNGAVRLGDGLALIGMLGYAYSILHTNRMLRTEGATVVQVSFLGVTGCAGYFIATALIYACVHPDGLALGTLAAQPMTMAGIAYMILFVSVAANFLQVAGQRRLPPVTVAILFCLEPAVAAVFDYFLLGNRPPLRVIASGALLAAATLLTALPAIGARRKRRREGIEA